MANEQTEVNGNREQNIPVYRRKSLSRNTYEIGDITLFHEVGKTGMKRFKIVAFRPPRGRELFLLERFCMDIVEQAQFNLSIASYVVEKVK